MAMRELTLERLPGTYAVCRAQAHEDFAAIAQIACGIKQAHSLLSITHTERELSIVIEDSLVPSLARWSPKVQRGFVAYRIVGTLDFSEVGILAKLTAALAAANVPVFVISTFDTDVILFSQVHEEAAVAALHSVADIRT
jgi:uncharacterized protein